MRRTVISSLATFTLLAAAAALPGSTADSDGRVCPPLDTGRIDTAGEPHSVTVTAPEGYAIDTVCIKAGSVQQGNGPELYEAGPDATSLTLGHSSGKAVSHWSASFTPLTTPTLPVDDPTPPPQDEPEPTPTPTPTPTVTPTPTPTPRETEPVVTPPTQASGEDGGSTGGDVGPVVEPLVEPVVEPVPPTVEPEPAPAQAPLPEAPAAAPVTQAPALAG